MPADTFSLEEGFAAPAAAQDEFPDLVPAKRTGFVDLPSDSPYTAGSDKEGLLPKDENLSNIIKDAATKYGVPLEYAYALAQQESGYNPAAVGSPTQYGTAKGMFQFLDSTAESLGIDPLDPTQAADAAMKDFAQQAREKGIDWAIKHHFAGPNVSQHGPKTRQYLADVLKRAQDIAVKLGKPGYSPNLEGDEALPPEEDNPQTLKHLAPGDTFSLEEGFGIQGGKVPERDEPFYEPIKAAAKRGFEYIEQRLKQEIPALRTEEDKELAARGIGQQVRIERTPEEIERLIDETPWYKKPQLPAALEDWKENQRKLLRYADVSAEPSDDRTLRWKQLIEQDPSKERDLPKDLEYLKVDPQLSGLLANMKNPLASITEDSLPASFASIYANLPDLQRKKFDEAQKVLMQENIVAHPDQFPAISVSQAQKAIDRRKAKQDPTIAQQWDALKEAAKEDPGKFAAQMINALIADPEMLAAPIGFGAKPLQAARAIATGERTAGRVIQLADRILDTGALGATINTGITAAEQLATKSHLDSQELAFSAAAGGVVGGVLGGILSRGAHAKIKDLDAAKGNGTYEQVLRDQAAYDVEVENIARNEWDPRATSPMQQRIMDMLGITNKTDREKWIAQRRKDVKEAFKTDSEYADYLKFKAEERIARSEQLAEERFEAAQRQQRAAEEDAAFASHADQQKAERQAEFEKAAAARDAAEAAGQHEEALRLNDQLEQMEFVRRMDDVDDVWSKSVPEVNRMLNRAGRRDAGIRRPKWQRGEADPETLARLGLVGAGAAAGYALAPDEDKMAGGFLGGLAGLFVPGVGRVSVLRRMRQSGAVSPDGNILGLVLKEDKLPAEAAIIEKAKAGDQQAMAKLYNQYFPRLERAARSFARTAGKKVGKDAEDIAQETFIQAFKNLDNFRGDSEFYTWLHSIMRNEGLQTVRRGESRIDTTSMHPSGEDAGPGSARAGHIMEGGNEGTVKGSVEAAAQDLDTPENMAIAKQVEGQLNKAFEALPEATRRVVKLKELEGYDIPEIAKMTGMKEDAVYQQLSRGKKAITEYLKKDLSAKPPRGQGGFIDQKLLKAGGVAALGAIGAATFLNTENKKLAATIGALGGLALLTKGRGGETLGKGLVKTIDKGLGVTSTRLMNISRPLWWRTMEHYRVVLRDTHKYMAAVDPFLVRLEKLPSETRGYVQRAILTGKQGVAQKLIGAIGDPQLSAGWREVRGVLDSIGDQLVHLKRFKNKEVDYFPRIVTDYAGLLKALGNEKGDFLNKIVDDANKKALRARGTELTDLERSLIINKALTTEPKLGGQPGFAKDRRIEEISKELQPYYATPTESLHSYIRSAVNDIERAKFFGKDLEVVEKGGKEYTNVDKSIGRLVDSLIQEKKITEAQAQDVSSMMKSLFMSGEKMPNEILQKAKNLSYAGLLGNPFSAVTQLGDVIIQTHIQGIRPTLSAVVRQLTGRKHVTMKEFGLADHLAEEFVNTEGTARFLRRAFKIGLFHQFDVLGKNTALNAAVSNFGRLAKSEGGVQRLFQKYGDVLQPKEFEQLVKDLQKGEATDLVRSVAFAELSKTQPVTRLEMPQAYLDNPNGRLLYQFKTFMLKQADVFRRDAYNEIKAGHVARGLKNLTTFSIALGVAGAGPQAIRDYLLGKPIDLSVGNVAMNMVKTFGLSEYVLDHMRGVTKEEAAERRERGDKGARTVKPAPFQTTMEMALPPAKMLDDIATADPQALRYIPIIGPRLLESYKKRKAEEAGQ